MPPLSATVFGSNILPVTSQSASHDIQVYSMYAMLSQHSNVFIRESWTSFSTAVVAVGGSAPHPQHSPGRSFSH